MRNLMILGLRGSGKDTVGRYLNDKCNYFQVALADRIRAACRELKIPITKTNLIKMGESMKKEFGDDIWINLCDETIDIIHKMFRGYENDTGIVVTDVRRKYEYDHYLSKGYLPIVISAPFETCVERAKQRDGTIDMSAFSHATENEFKSLNGYKVFNETTLEELYVQLDNLMTEIQDESTYESYMDLIRQGNDIFTYESE